MQSLCLEYELYRGEFDGVNGSLCQLRDNIAQIDLVAKPRMPLSLSLPTQITVFVAMEN